MKNFLALIFTLILTFSLSACGNTNMDNSSLNDGSQDLSDTSSNQSAKNQLNGLQTQIDRDTALEIALKKTGVKEADVKNIDIELDTENGVIIWEVDFDYGEKEYSYNINAQNGAIVKVERD